MGWDGGIEWCTSRMWWTVDLLLGAPVVYTRPAVVMVSFLHGGEGNYYLIVVCARSHRGTARHGPFSDKCQNELHVWVESCSGRMSVVVFLLFIAPYNCWNCLRCHNNDNVTKVWIRVWWTAGPIISASTVAPFCFLFFFINNNKSTWMSRPCNLNLCKCMCICLSASTVNCPFLI